MADRVEGIVVGDGAQVVEDAGTQPTSWARRVLLVLSAAHAGILVFTAHAAPTWELGPGFWALVAVNALAIAGLATRTRIGWVATLLCVLFAAAYWGGMSADQPTGLLGLLAIAFAVFCVTDPSLRREHDLAS